MLEVVGFWATWAIFWNLYFLSISLFRILSRWEYSRLSLSRSRRDPLKHFEISVLRYIRCAVLRKYQSNKQISQRNMNLTPLVRNICRKYCGKERQEQFLLLAIISCYLMLDIYVKTGIRFSLREKRLREITEFEITRVDYVSKFYKATSANEQNNLVVYGKRQKQQKSVLYI